MGSLYYKDVDGGMSYLVLLSSYPCVRCNASRDIGDVEQLVARSSAK